MSQQINLFDARLRRQRDLLTAHHLALAVLLLGVIIGGWGATARGKLAALEAETQRLAPQAKSLQEEMAAAGKQLANMKPDPRLASDLASTQAILGLRDDIVAALKKGVGTEAISFAAYLRGFAHQSVGGLWLTGIAIGEEGTALEIRGRMTDPALLPEYIQRLNGEKTFRGLAFAELKVATAHPPAATDGKPDAAPAKSALYHEFTLAPAKGLPTSMGDTPPMKLAAAPTTDLVPTELGRTLAEAGRSTREDRR